MDPLKTIGKILTESQRDRDAIHVAILPVVALEPVRPGAPLVLHEGRGPKRLVRRAYGNDAVGIADPFLSNDVLPGERFWLFLFPGTVTTLRHHWTHPKVADMADIETDSEMWLRSFAERWSMRYHDLIEAATAPASADGYNYVVAHGRDLHYADELGKDHDLFWQNLEQLTGKRFDQDHREKFVWSCSC